MDETTTAEIQYDEDGIEITQLDAQGLHPPYDGVHTHAHDHGPPSSAANLAAPHNHPHIHHNDSHHLHDHTGNIDGDGGAPDGDGDSDEWNEPAFPTGGSNAIPPPNDGRSNPGRANNAGSNESRTNKSLDPAAQALLASYNSLGKVLGFGSVDVSGMREDGLTLTGDNSAQWNTYLMHLQETGLHLVEAANSMALRLAAVVPDSALAGKAQLDSAHAVHAQSIHDHANAIMGGKACVSRAMATEPDTTASTTPPPAQAAPLVALSAQSTTAPDISQAVTSQLDTAQRRIDELNAQILALQGRGLGRPTAFLGRTIPLGLEQPPVLVAMQTPEELRSKTLIARRSDGVKCRQWPTGHGEHQRPPLSNDQMSIMSLRDMEDYHEGREALVPIIFDGD